MILEANFKEVNHEINSEMGDVYVVTDYGKDYADGYDEGHEEGERSGYISGYEQGSVEGYQQGYGVGFEEGKAQGGDTETAYNEGLEAGKQAEYDRFWDLFQNYGNRGNYQNGFCGTGSNDAWTDETFKPKYDLILTWGYTGNGMFIYSPLTNIAETLENLGLRLDTTKCGYFSQMFQSSATKRIPEIVCTNEYGYGLEYTFTNSQVETIDKLVVMESLTYPNSFNGCTNLKNIIFDGVIGNNIDFSACVALSKASIENIIGHLSTTASGKTLTLSSTAVTSAFGSTTASAWTTLVNSKKNWTISLV